MNVQQMKVVVAVANNGSFREAAKKLFMAQPSLSYAVKELEEELGTTLFERTNKGANLTEEGIEFVHYAEKILAEFERMEYRYSDTKKKSTHFSVSAQHYDFLGVIISQLLDRAPNVKSFRVFESTTQKIIEDVASFRSEVGIIFLDDMNTTAISRVLEENSLTYESIASFHTHIFLGKHHPLASRKFIEVEDLVNYPQIRFTQEANNYSYFQEDLIEFSEESRVIHTSDRATLTNILQRTNAYGTGSGFVESTDASQIVTIPLKRSSLHRVSVLYPKNKPLTPVANEFIRLLKDYLLTFNKEKKNDEE